uniref:Uncharacterized protein n=1 Tax=Setaria viridis TaxID=4556 RepID=A0A4V6D6X4_SETVI|nr:hypothetical protein SEVIR_5G257766v2 [Setaria viridis]
MSNLVLVLAWMGRSCGELVFLALRPFSTNWRAASDRLRTRSRF